MDLALIFPSDYFKHNKPDEMFKAQADAFLEAGFECNFISLDQLETLTKLSIDLSGKVVIYRGWMLDSGNYLRLAKVIENSNGKLFIPLDRYLLAHHLPNWYPLIREYTIETVVLDEVNDLKQQLFALGWGQYFIKDYVKSLKTSIGSIIKNAEHIDITIHEMKKFRGTIEGGVCVRRVEDFLVETEQRFFIINGTPYSRLADQPIPEIILRCNENIDHKFYSVDLIKRRDGKDVIVEIGDGQVSDYVGWELKRFVEVLSVGLSGKIN